MPYNIGMSKREENKQAVRKRILDAAAKLFSERDYASTTIDDVVVASGVARATVYANFAGKDELAAAVARQLLAGLFEKAAESLAGRAEIGSALTLVNRQTAQWLAENRSLATRFFAYIAQQNDFSGVAAEKPSIREALAQAFAVAQGSGQLRKDIAPTEFASIYAYLWFQACSRWTQQPDGFALEVALARAADVFLNGSRS